MTCFDIYSYRVQISKEQSAFPSSSPFQMVIMVVSVAAMITLFSLQATQAHLLKEKISHLQFYFHDKISGKNVTAVKVALAPTTEMSAIGFRLVYVLDDRLTKGPKPTSKLVGKAQGLYASTSQEEV
ncbi:hypothetical protein SUGI_1131280 [Cryptomeria japonica]|nr:hypothetical protein SUGI_1131280 [Cryptomeria japonica]